MSVVVPFGHLGEDVGSKILCETDPQYLNEGNANGGASNDRQMVGRGEPKLTGLQTTLHVDDVIHIAQVRLFSDVVATLYVFNDLSLFGFAAWKGNTASFSRPKGRWRAVKIDVHVPIFWTVNSTAFQPVSLDPINEVLLICVISVVYDEGFETTFGLFFDPIFENEPENSGGKFQN